MNILLHVLVSIFGDFTSVLGQGKQVRLYFFMSQCLYLEILPQCWGRGSKFGYSSSRLMHQCIFGDDILSVLG